MSGIECQSSSQSDDPFDRLAPGHLHSGHFLLMHAYPVDVVHRLLLLYD